MERLNRMSWLVEAIPTQRRSNNQGVRSTTEASAVGHAPPRIELKSDGNEHNFECTWQLSHRTPRVCTMMVHRKELL